MLDAVCAKLASGKKVILVHSNADMDAMGSAYALARGFKADIYAPNGMDRLTKNVVANMGIPVIEGCDLSSYDSIFIVDTSSPEQLEADLEIPRSAVVIDHHMPTGKWDVDVFYCQEGRTSCCEVVKDVMEHAGAEIDRDAALALLCGIMSDTAHLRFADPRTLRAFADLMELHGFCMEEVNAISDNPMTISERVAVMKVLGNLKFDRVGECIVATAVCGNYEASVARAMVDSGADVAFVASQRGETYRVSSRATQDIVAKGLHLGELMKGLGSETGSDGGGHSGAAGISGIGDPEAMLSMCMSRAMDFFRSIRDRQRISAASSPSPGRP